MIIFEDTDIIKIYCEQIMSALGSVVPHPRMEKVSFTNLNAAKESFGKSCKKLMFITDEKFRAFSSRRIELWIAALLRNNTGDQGTLVLNINCETDSPADHFFDVVHPCSQLVNSTVTVNRIQQFECWWPRVIKYVF